MVGGQTMVLQNDNIALHSLYCNILNRFRLYMRCMERKQNAIYTQLFGELKGGDLIVSLP